MAQHDSKKQNKKKDPPCLATRGQQHIQLKGTSKNKNLSGCKKHWWGGGKRERGGEGGVPFSTITVVCFRKEKTGLETTMDKKGERKKRLDKKERTTKKKNGLLRVLSLPLPPNWLSTNRDRANHH